MTLTVKFFAALRQAQGREQVSVTLEAPCTVSEAWSKATGDSPFPPGTLAAVNMTYAPLDRLVHAGDELAFFPPVTGG